MARTTSEKIGSIGEQIQQLENERKRLLSQQKEQERKARTNRLCKRGGYMESVMPELPTLTEEQFKSLIEKTLLSDFARRTLANIAAKGGELTALKPAITEPDINTVGTKNEDNGARVSG